MLETRIVGTQRSLETMDSANLVRLERELQEEYQQPFSQEEILWFQKSREQWVQFDDRNTSFFSCLNFD